MNGTANDETVWQKLAAPIPSSDIEWRIDGKPTARDGKYFSRFVAYVNAQFVRARLDSVVPGEWDLALELLPPLDVIGKEGVVTGKEFAFKARLTVLGVIREDVGSGDDYKSAASDAFKRAAVRFGVAHDLYSYGQNWVEVDGDGKYAKPVEDPQKAYERKQSGAKQERVSEVRTVSGNPPPGVGAAGASSPLAPSEAVACPKCQGRMYDNRVSKRNPKAPDYKCQNRNCDGVIWPPREGDRVKGEPREALIATDAGLSQNFEDFQPALVDDELDSLPF